MFFKNEEAFDADYLYFYETFLTPERNEREAELIARLAELEPGMRVLDVPCGHGRIANCLAARGVCVTGLDITPLFLERARQEAVAAGVSVDYVQGDMRALPWTAAFDAILVWFTAFGYFEEAENERVLREIGRALKPGGTLILDQPNRATMLRNWQSTVVTERGEDLMLDRIRYDPFTDRAEAERIITRGGRTRRTQYSIRYYGLPEFHRLLTQAGFEDLRVFDTDGKPATASTPRWVLVARRRRTED